MESGGGEEAHRRRRLAVQGDVHQHQLDSPHPSYGACTHGRPSDGNTFLLFLLLCELVSLDRRGWMLEVFQQESGFSAAVQHCVNLP